MALEIVTTDGAAMPRKSNRHPVDELAEVRAEIKRLQEREAALRAEILGRSCGLIGFDYRAVIREQAEERVDTKAIRAGLTPAQLAPFLKSSKKTILTLERREPDPDEIGDLS